MKNIENSENFDQFLDEIDEKNCFMLEEEIDIEIQNKYFIHSRKIDEDITKDEVMSNIHMLGEEEVSDDKKKTILTQLASLRDVEAYRVLEKKCRQFDNEELNTWSILAYNESKMILNGSLRNEQQIFISTGLGGKDGKFRYFIALFPSHEDQEFTDFQRDFVTKELDFTLKQNNAALERVIESTNEYISCKVLIPIKANVPELFKKVLKNCNQLADFVSKQFIITNVNEMKKNEILDFLYEINEDDENDIIEDIVSLN